MHSSESFYPMLSLYNPSCQSFCLFNKWLRTAPTMNDVPNTRIYPGLVVDKYWGKPNVIVKWQIWMQTVDYVCLNQKRFKPDIYFDNAKKTFAWWMFCEGDPKWQVEQKTQRVKIETHVKVWHAYGVGKCRETVEWKIELPTNTNARENKCSDVSLMVSIVQMQSNSMLSMPCVLETAYFFHDPCHESFVIDS